MATHTINKVLLDFSFAEKEKDVALKKTNDIFYEKALPQLSSQFDSIIPHIYIDRLEIDVGKTDVENFSEQFYKAATLALQEYFYKKDSREMAQTEESSKFSADTIIYFLQRGYWQWNFQLKTDAEIATLIKQILENESEALRLFTLLKKENEYARERFASMMLARYSLTEIFLRQIKKYHSALQFSFLIEIAVNLTENEKYFYSVLLKETFAFPPLRTVEEVKFFLKNFIQLYLREYKKEIIHLKKKLKILNYESNSGEWRNYFNLVQQSFQSNFLFSQQKINNVQAIETSVGDIQRIAFIAPKYFDEGEKIHVPNAGLILFHPYLSYVFRELNWINDEKKFVDEFSQQRAILFLQYVINQKSKQPEHELVLNKVLCNWPVAKPVLTKINFFKKEKNAAVELLESLKEHWAVLKTTSRPGLIKSFIERKGMLQQCNDGFLLQVEKNTIDILMESLPFGIQTIKLPWNEYLIHTEWTY